jgi:DNA-binding CsgD family transcriptional regulator
MLAGVVAYEWAMTGGPGPACVDLARHATGGAGLLSRTVNGSVPYVAALLTLVLADDEGALAATREAFEAAHRAGSLLSASSGRLFHGMALARRGELEEAAELERAAGTDLDAWGFVTVRLFPGSLLAEILVETGDLDGARRALRHANPGDGPMPDNTNSAYWLSSRLRLLVAEGAHREALALAEDCRRRFAGSVVNPAFIPWRSLGAEALQGLGRTEEAVALAAGEVPPARLWGAPGALGRALRVLGTLRGPGDGLPALEEAVAVTAGTPARLEHARALAALGTALRLLRRPSEAREPLRRALETATVCGAAPLAEHARTELHAAGARPRTAALSGAGALTASERRVADLAGGGMSNRDIAQALYVTPKTVEVHLSSTYRKLGIRSRRELGAALAAG